MAVIIYGHVFVAAVPDYYVGVYECVCVGVSEHWVSGIIRTGGCVPPGGGPHLKRTITHTPAADQASSWDLFSRVAEFSLMLDCCVRLHVSVRAKSKAS